MVRFSWICTLAIIITACLSPASSADDRGTREGGISQWAQDRINQRVNPMEQKLKKLVIDRIEAENITVRDLLRLVRQKARDTDPEGKGFNLVTRADKQHLAATLSLDLRDVPVLEILEYIRLTTHIRFILEEHAVVVVDKTTDDE